MPHPELEEDVGRHVERVARIARDLCVRSRGAEREAGVIRIVEIVQQVVQRARVLRVRLQRLFQNRSHLPLGLAAGKALRSPLAGVRAADQAA